MWCQGSLGCSRTRSLVSRRGVLFSQEHESHIQTVHYERVSANTKFTSLAPCLETRGLGVQAPTREALNNEKMGQSTGRRFKEIRCEREWASRFFVLLGALLAGGPKVLEYA